MGDVSELAVKLIDKIDGVVRFLVPIALTGVIAGAALKLVSKPLVYSASGAVIDIPVTALVTSSSLLLALGLFALGKMLSRIATQYVKAERARITSELNVIRGNLMTNDMCGYDEAYSLIEYAMEITKGGAEFLIDVDAVDLQEDSDYYAACVWELRYFADKKYLTLINEDGSKNVLRVILDPDVAFSLRLAQYVNDEERERIWNLEALPTVDKWKAAFLGIPHFE